MPRRDDLETILLIGSGPIVIGQACEFDYSGTQACRVLREEGFRVVLVNSNPATIMTDPEFADATYVEPLDVPTLDAHHRARNGPTRCCRRSAARPGSTSRSRSTKPACSTTYDVEMIGANVEAIHTAEDRQRFKIAMTEIGLRGAAVGHRVHASTRRCTVADEVGYPVIVRPAFILGGGGTGIAHDPDEMQHVAARGLAASPISEILIERSVVGLEGVRARGDARPRRQRRRHLLDRERRPDGRAHRRVDHRRARADAHRRRVPAHARRRVRVHPPHRRRDRRLQRAVRGRPADRRAWSSSR